MSLEEERSQLRTCFFTRMWTLCFRGHRTWKQPFLPERFSCNCLFSPHVLRIRAGSRHSCKVAMDSFSLLFPPPQGPRGQSRLGTLTLGGKQSNRNLYIKQWDEYPGRSTCVFKISSFQKLLFIYRGPISPAGIDSTKL